jgi:propanediol dehydratase small subunit
MTHIGRTSYPLAGSAGDSLQAASGRLLSEVNLEAAAAGALAAGDIQISAATLRAQAEIARQAGYGELAANLVRAAELTAVPNAELLRMYELLRPGRSTYDELVALAGRLEEEYGAAETGAFVREAAAVYQARDLFRRP